MGLSVVGVASPQAERSTVVPGDPCLAMIAYWAGIYVLPSVLMISGYSDADLLDGERVAPVGRAEDVQVLHMRIGPGLVLHYDDLLAITGWGEGWSLIVHRCVSWHRDLLGMCIFLAGDPRLPASRALDRGAGVVRALHFTSTSHAFSRLSHWHHLLSYHCY